MSSPVSLESRLVAAPDLPWRPHVTLDPMPQEDGSPCPLSPGQLAVLEIGWSYLRDQLDARQPGQAAVVAEFRPGFVRVLWADPAAIIAMMAAQDGTPPAPALADPCPAHLVPVCVLQLDAYATCRLSLHVWKQEGAHV